MRVLIVDDDEAMADVMVMTVERAGYEVALASNGAEALDRVREGSFDLVVSDILMPYMDGLELIPQIRQLLPEARIIAVSGGGRYSDSTMLLTMANDIGADCILPKPFTPTQLTEVMEKLLSD